MRGKKEKEKENSALAKDKAASKFRTYLIILICNVRQRQKLFF